MEQKQYTGHLPGDSEYPLRAYVVTLISNPARDSEIKYNAAHAKTRNIVERAFGVWKRGVRVLSSQLHSKLNISLLAKGSAAILHNIGCCSSK